jgi:hypothetical protein
MGWERRREKRGGRGCSAGGGAWRRRRRRRGFRGTIRLQSVRFVWPGETESRRVGSWHGPMAISLEPIDALYTLNPRGARRRLAGEPLPLNQPLKWRCPSPRPHPASPLRRRRFRFRPRRCRYISHRLCVSWLN